MSTLTSYIQSLAATEKLTGEKYTTQQLLKACIHFLRQQGDEVALAADKAEFESHLTSLQLIYGSFIDESKRPSKNKTTSLG